MMMITRRNFFSNAKKVWNTIFKKDGPREIEERSDLYKAILALKFRNLRRGKLREQCSHISSSSTRSAAASTAGVESDEKLKERYNIMMNHKEDLTKEDLEMIFEEASMILEKEMEIHTLSNKSLRTELQNVLGPDIIEILELCKQIDDDFPTTSSKMATSNSTSYASDNNSSSSTEENVHQFCKEILLKDHIATLEYLEDILNKDNDEMKDSHHYRQIPFLKTKISSIETLASFNGWEQSSTIDSVLGTTTPSSNDDGNGHNEPDCFGYTLVDDEAYNKAIRYHQMMNMTKGVLIRQNLGYSTLALKSTIPQNTNVVVERGIFVDGFVEAGSLVAFFPGQVWPKEHLLNITKKSSNNSSSSTSIFKNDVHYQLSMRYDDILIDSRDSSYTVLNGKSCNPFAIAHIANHPPLPSKRQQESGENDDDTNNNGDMRMRITMPNCNTAMINFTQSMNIQKRGLEQYIPNTYAREPMLLGPKTLFEVDTIQMPGLALIANRDVENEELFFNYRLSSGPDGSYPDWYHVLTTQEEEDYSDE